MGFVPGVIAFVATMSGLFHHLRMLGSKRMAKAKLAELEKQAAEGDAKGATAVEGGKRRKRDIHWDTM